ncbi:polysaccharide pyruvyl transferase family protein [Amycolatopsis sp. H20-H5]|uniref:polysaccharide pyruvyl transferase family protein n=1 Tax=Amycolatopsis sp. H20-H5 TaxID=3046309 RepID=UPI002DB84AF8|nr:polysaccharide pyruvyl transferase family protein [Amycolatopsis sp. H20-H5]MEC3976533.1 polysaccharide pyruvyl transferase family protein [Amycolatopsis sp. H20-H5]
MSTKVGLFGLLGSGNLGNDGSLEAVLGFLAEQHPDAVVSAFCGGPEQVRERYGIETVPLHWNQSEYETASGVKSIAGKGFGKLVDVFRTAAWVRRQDVVIVPGMGVLEATLPLRPWGFPYSLLLLCASGRVVGTKVALVSVGANVIGERATRAVVKLAAGFAAYRSYRDELSRDAMREMGVDVSRDEVYPDLAFSLPIPVDVPAAAGTVGVGVMDYHGGNTDRARADEIHEVYVAKMKQFVRRLVSDGREVRLFTGDSADEAVVDEILADVQRWRPGHGGVAAARVSCLDDLMREMAAVDAVVATRFHNVLCALKLSKPTISLGYAVKNDVLMAQLGLAEFCQPVRTFEVDRLIGQLATLERQGPEVRETMTMRNAEAAARLRHQFSVLTGSIFPNSTVPKSSTAEREEAR